MTLQIELLASFAIGILFLVILCFLMTFIKNIIYETKDNVLISTVELELVSMELNVLEREHLDRLDRVRQIVFFVNATIGYIPLGFLLHQEGHMFIPFFAIWTGLTVSYLVVRAFWTASVVSNELSTINYYSEEKPEPPAPQRERHVAPHILDLKGIVEDEELSVDIRAHAKRLMNEFESNQKSLALQIKENEARLKIRTIETYM